MVNTNHASTNNSGSGDEISPPPDADSHPTISTDDPENPRVMFTETEQEEVAASSAAAASSPSNQQKLCHRTSFRICIVLLIIAGCIGLAVGLTVNKNSSAAEAVEGATLEDDNNGNKNNNDNVDGKIAPTSPPRDITFNTIPTPFPTYGGFFDNGGTHNEDDGSCSSDPALLTTPVIHNNDDNQCVFQLRQTVQVTSPLITGINDTVLQKKLSGGTSSTDGNDSFIVAYNSDGSAGAVWMIGKRNSTVAEQQEEQVWEQMGILQTTDEDQLGWSVSIKNSMGVIGAPGQDGKEMPTTDGMGWYWAGKGKAIVMAKQQSDNDNGEEWVEEAVLLPKTEAAENAAFGSTVDIAESGNTIAVGAWHDRDSRGSVYIFGKDDSDGWKEVQKLAPADSRRSQSDHLHGNFGYTVALTDEYLAVKAPFDSYTGSYDFYDPYRGMVYIYKKNLDGTFDQVDRLCTPEGMQVRETLRDVLFLDNARLLLVGAPGKNKVYVFERSGVYGRVDYGYKKTAELTPSDEENGESKFGISLSGNGLDVLVGDIGNARSYLFSLEDGMWKEKAKFDGVNTVMADKTIVEHTPKSFGVDLSGEGFGGDVNFYDLVCDQ